jgi:hypothetical protein
MSFAPFMPLLLAATVSLPAAAGPKEPCTLLKPAEIQMLAADAKIGNGVSNPQPPLGAACEFRWGPRTKEWGEALLTIQVVVDPSAARRVGFVSGCAFAVCYLLVRALLLRDLR